MNFTTAEDERKISLYKHILISGCEVFLEKEFDLYAGYTLKSCFLGPNSILDLSAGSTYTQENTVYFLEVNCLASHFRVHNTKIMKGNSISTQFHRRFASQSCVTMHHIITPNKIKGKTIYVNSWTYLFIQAHKFS